MPPTQTRITQESSLEDRQNHTRIRIKGNLDTFTNAIRSQRLADGQFRGAEGKSNIVGIPADEVPALLEEGDDADKYESKRKLLAYTAAQLEKIEAGKKNDFQD